MTEIAYMVREDWAQQGTAMAEQSAMIRTWLGGPPYLFFAPDIRKHHSENEADQEFVDYLSPEESNRHIFDLSELGKVKADELDHAVTIIHPFKDRDCEMLREIIDVGSVARMFVIIWSPSDRVRIMLDALGAVNLHTGGRSAASDDLQRRAARLMVDEQYNGLESGRGKDAAVQLLRTFSDEGYPLDERAWLHALYAEGGTFASGEVVARFIREMQTGRNHRIRSRFVPDIVTVLKREVPSTAELAGGA